MDRFTFTLIEPLNPLSMFYHPWREKNPALQAIISSLDDVFELFCSSANDFLASPIRDNGNNWNEFSFETYPSMKMSCIPL